MFADSFITKPFFAHYIPAPSDNPRATFLGSFSLRRTEAGEQRPESRGKWPGTQSELWNLRLWVRWALWRRQWHPTQVFLPGKSHGWRSLVGCSPWGRKESDTTEWLHFHFSLSCIGEGNGNPLQCSCLDNPRDGGAWWAAIYGVAQSRTRLKRLSSSKE